MRDLGESERMEFIGEVVEIGKWNLLNKDFHG